MMQLFFMWFGAVMFGGLCGIGMVETVWYVRAKIGRKRYTEGYPKEM